MTSVDPLQAVAEGAEAVRDQESAAEISRTLGHATSTVTRRAHLEVIDWAARDVLRLALTHPALAAAIVAALTSRPLPSGDPSQVVADLCAEAEASGALASEIRRALSDGVLTARVIDRVLECLQARQQADAALARDLRAKRRGVRS